MLQIERAKGVKCNFSALKWSSLQLRNVPSLCKCKIKMSQNICTFTCAISNNQ